MGVEPFRPVTIGAVEYEATIGVDGTAGIDRVLLERSGFAR